MYVDGNTGSMLVQAAVAGVAGVGVAGAAVWHKVKSPLKRNKKNAAETETPTPGISEQQ